MANNFSYYAPKRVYFGKDEEKNIGKYMQEYHARQVMVIYGGKSARSSGLLDLVRTTLEAAGIAVSELGGIVPRSCGRVPLPTMI